MKYLLSVLTILFFTYTINAQKGELKYGTEHNFGKVVSDTSSSAFFTQHLGSAYFWAASSDQPSKIAVKGSSGEVFINPENNHFYALSKQYYDGETSEMYNTLITEYSNKGKVLNTYMYKNFTADRLCFNPASNEIAFIGMNEDYEYVCGVKNLSEEESFKVIFQGKGALIPLIASYNYSGSKIAVGYGRDSKNGGVRIYNTDGFKLLKDLKFSDHPKSLVWKENGDLVVHGAEKLTAVYDTKSWSSKNEYKHVFSSIDPSGNTALLLKKNGEAYFFNLNDGTQIKIEHPSLNEQEINQDVALFYGTSNFSEDGDYAIISLVKSPLRSDKIFQLSDSEKAKLKTKPSILIAPVNL